MCGYYGDKKFHGCKKEGCDFQGLDTEFDPILSEGTLDDGTPISICGFKCPRCGFEFFEQEVNVNDKDQKRLRDF